METRKKFSLFSTVGNVVTVEILNGDENTPESTCPDQISLYPAKFSLKNMDDVLEILRQDETFDRPFLAREALKKLRDIFREDLNDLEAVIYTAKALDPADGIPRYVSVASQPKYKNTDQPVKDAVDLIHFIVSSLASASELSVSNLVDWSIRFLDRDTGNDIKSNVIKLVHTVVENCTGLNVEWESVLTRLKNYLTSQRKIPPSFRDSLFTVFGKICAVHPTIAVGHQEWFFRHLIQALEEYRNGKGISDVLVEASFNGLNGVLVNFSPDNIKVFYDNLKMYSNLNLEKRARNTLARSALRVFTAHGCQFSKHIFNDYREWHRTLLAWIDFKQSVEHKQMGFLALSAFYKIVSQNLESGYFLYIFNYFRKHFEAHHSNSFFVKNLLIGVAALSKNFLRYSTKEDLETLLKKFEGNENPALLGIRFEALSKIDSALGNGSRMNELTTLAVYLIENYPKIDKTFQKYCADALENSFCVWTAQPENLETVFYQALLRCCACPIPTDIQVLEDEECIALKDYIPLWKRLLSLNQRSVSSSQTRAGKAIFKIFIDCFIRILRKVDLSLEKISGDFLNPAQNYQPRSPNDFLIFVNAVELFEQVAVTPDLLDFTHKVVEVCIGLSSQNPFVSGFYKIIAGCLVLDDCVDEGFVKFLAGVIRRVDSLTDDDLLLANLKLILFSPARVIRGFVPDLGLIFDTAIRTAHGFPELYERIVNALDQWHEEINLDKVLLLALPKLSSTLLNPSHQRGKIHSMIAQKRFLMFLAKLEPDTRYVEEVQETFSLDSVPPLVYKLSLPDKKASLGLNRMIPRIIDLAVFSAERGTRVTSAEILHSVILITLARTRDETNFTQLLRMLLQACMTLACDSDPFFKNLFRQLMTQIVHYYAAKRFQQEKIILEILFEGVTHPIDSGLRQFGSDCLQEFVSWSEGNLQAVDQILGMICDFTLHPDRTKRIGGVIAFNRIFSSVDRMMLKKLGPVFLRNFFGCLQACDKDEDADLVLVAVEHVRELFDGSCDNDLFEVFKTGFDACQNENPRVSRIARRFVSHLGVPVSSYVKSKNIEVRFRGRDPLTRISYTHWLIMEKVVGKQNMELEVARGILKNFPVESANCYRILETILEHFLLSDAVTQSDVEDFAKIFTKLNHECQKLYKILLTSLKDSPDLGIFLNHVPKFDETALIKNITNGRFLNIFEILDASGLVDLNYSGDEILSKIFEQVNVHLSTNLVDHFKQLILFAAKRDLTARMVIELITHDELVDTITTKGEFFYNLFRTELSDFLASIPETAIIFVKTDSGLRWMISILSTSKDSRTVINRMFTDWALWSSKWNDEQLVDLLKIINKVHPIKSPNVIQWFNNLPVSTKPNCSEILKIFELFPQLYNEGFPLEALERNWVQFGRGDVAKTFSPVFEHMLVACETNWSYKLFKYFFESAALNESVLSFSRIEQSLTIMSGKFSSLDMCLLLFDLIFLEFADRWSIFFVNNALTTLLKIRFDHDFFKTRIDSLLRTLESPLTDRVYRDLARKCCATELMKIFYERTTQDDRKRIQDFVGDPQLFKKILMACSLRPILCEDKELLRLFYCGCVGVMCAFSKQLTDSQRIDSFVLRIDMWSYVVSNSEPYQLPINLVLKKFREKRVVRKGYVNSMASTLFESTLREDVRNFDFSHVTIAQASDSETDFREDPLNSWESMKEFCACLKDLSSRGFNVDSFLMKSLSKGTFNEKCIIFKLIYNCDLKLNPNMILTAIKTVLLAGGMNFLIQDLLNMMTKQGNNASNGNLVLEVIDLIIEKSSNIRENDLRQIINTLKNVIEFWKSTLKTSNTVQMLTKRMNQTDSYNIFINLELASILLVNDLLQMNEDCVIKVLSWLQGICSSDARHANMAAEVYGLLLTKTKISQENLKKDVIILYHVHKFYPEISSNYVDYLFQRAWQERTVVKEYALEMLLSHMRRRNHFGSVELETAFVPFASDVLKSASQPAQELILQIINIDCCDKATEKLLPDILKLTKDSSSKIRELACDVLMKFCATDDNVKFALMQRINDSDAKISEKVVKFFSKLCPNGSKNRLNFIMSEMYAPETEADFLEYAVRLLVEPSSTTPDFFLPIFDYPLTECHFTDLQFNKTFLSTFTPMFAPSIVTLDTVTIKKPTSGLVLHRTYRQGDYPDIQIKNSEFIRLLLELIAKDRQFRKILFITLFSAVCDECDSEQFAKFVEKSQGDDLGCVAGFMEIALERGVCLPVEGIARLATRTGLLSLGALLIELAMTETSNAPKRRKSDTAWLRLAEIFYDLKDTQAVRGIFLNHLDVNACAKLAILNEISLDFSSAAEYYQQAINQEVVQDYLNFYNQSYFTSLAHLSDWGKILTCIDGTCSDEELWTDCVLLQPWKIRAEMLVNSSNFVSYVDRISVDDWKRSQLVKFSEEASVACWLKGDMPKAISFIHNALTNFLNQWTNSSVWDCTLRKNYLQNLQIIAEIYDIVDVLSAKSRTSAMQKFNRNQMPNERSELTVWDVRLRLRQYFKDLILDENFSTQLTDSFLSFSEAAAFQENFTLSRRYLQLTQGSLKMNPMQTARWREIRKVCSIVEIKRGKSKNKVLDYFNLLTDDDTVNLKIFEEMIVESEKSGCFEWDFLPRDQKNLKQSWRMTFERVVENLSPEHRAVGYLKFAKILKNSVEFHWIAVAILKSMRYGCQEAREMFALVLSTDLHGDDGVVLQESRLVPSWMFLMWKNQLVAYLSKNSPMITEIVERLRTEYPGAFHFHSKGVDKIFVEEISQLVNPFLKMRYFIDQVEFALEAKTPDWQIIHRAFTAMRKIVDAPETENNRIIRKSKTAVDNFCKINHSGKLLEALKTLREDIKVPGNFYKSVRNLKHFSTWLSEFRSFSNERLEIPTSVYDGFSEPRERERVFVAYFKPTVLVIRSIREPVKLTMIGTDAREYSFLVKFGEDLRQDERIQQILSQIRRTCLKKCVGDLVTYRVEPLTEDLGLIQWLDSCKTLRQVMAVDDETLQRVSFEHVQFLSGGKNVTIVDAYRDAVQTKSFQDARNAFEQRVRCFKEDALRSGIYKLTQSPEEFFGFRKNFAQSLAVLSVAHWVIGVGDRHLDNILISTKTGCVVGIDFGMAFGFATQFLPLPELVPFRLTPQMIRVLSPLNENGWLKLSMIEALESIRADPSVLLAILQVFVLEPSLNWVQQAKRLARQQGGTVHSNWYQASKIKTVEDKLSGIHPVDCFEVDLKTGRSSDSCLERLLAVLNGVGTVRGVLRTRRNLSAEEQIRCLIDLAMDPVVLSFTYVGWCPWL